MHTEKANAKINTYLNIQSRREDGYHNIVSVMQTVSLCDFVTVDLQPAQETEITLSVLGNAEVPTDSRNLAWRAAERFLQQLDMRAEVHIAIQKHIPMAAGLGGGSADAAAVLRALNRLCQMPFTTEELCQIGLTLGADVPFCIRGGAMLVEGIGEVLHRAPDMPPCTLVVAIGEEGVSTPQAYALLDEKYSNFEHPHNKNNDVRELMDLWQKGDLAASCIGFSNIFEDVIAEQNADVNAIKLVLDACGAMRSLMSGSGPSVFGIFEDANEAEQALASLQKMGFRAFVCHPCKGYED